MLKQFLFGISALAGGVAFGQRTHFDEGNIYFEQRLYKEAIQEYNLALNEKVVINKDLMLDRIARTYHMLFEYSNAEKAYRKLLDESSSIEADHYFQYARILINNEKYDEAISTIHKYTSKGGDHQMADMLSRKAGWAKNNQDLEQRFDLSKTNIETGSRSIGVAFYKNGLLLAHPETQDFLNHTAYYNLAYAAATNPTTFETPVYLDGELGHDYYEGAPSLTSNGKVLYFTKNSSDITKFREKKLEKKKDKYAISNDGVNILKICTAREENGKWKGMSEHPVSSYEYDVTFPFISDDGKTLYFVSNMPGGLGGYDIYRCKLQSDSSWSKPENLGPEVNSPMDEMYPHVFENLLYFSSKGREGFGGADIFCALITGDSFQNVVNIGKPFNSSKDDFALIMSRKEGKKYGYLSSNREGENGYDYVYYFEEKDLQVQRFKVIESPVDQMGTQVIDLTAEVQSTEKFMVAENGEFVAVKKIESLVYELEMVNVEPAIAEQTCIAMVDEDGEIIGYASYRSGSVFIASLSEPLASCPKQTEPTDTVVIARDLAQPVSFKKMHGYNKLDLDDAKEFTLFMDGVQRIAEIKGTATISIESSASYVPTTRFGTNQKLATARANELKERIAKDATQRGMKNTSLMFAETRALVQGPAYNDDFENQQKYDPYQYVKADAK